MKVFEVKEKVSKKLLELQLGKGEASAIALAIELNESLIILDDQKARKIAEKLGVRVTGTIGVIIKAKLMGIIPSIKPLILKIKKTNFYISNELESIALKEAKEAE